MSCRCKQSRCSTCHKCKRCGCICNKHGGLVGNNRSCWKLLELPQNINQPIPTITHHNDSTSRKRRGRPPKNKRVLSDSIVNNPLSPNSPTTSPPQKSLMTPTAYTVRRQSQTETPSKVFTSNPIQCKSSDIGSRVKSLTRNTLSRQMYHKETSIQLFQSPFNPRNKTICSTPD